MEMDAVHKKKEAAGSFNHHWMQYSTTVPNDPDTHEDFMPANKLQNSDLSLKDIVEQDVNDNPVMIYMKGVPDLPRCGFSSLAMRVLKEYSTCSTLNTSKGIPYMICDQHASLEMHPSSMDT
ncbi:hypothetical protein CsSME_00020218 [Camellia sinensis var. sinensis]